MNERIGLLHDGTNDQITEGIEKKELIPVHVQSVKELLYEGMMINDKDNDNDDK